MLTKTNNFLLFLFFTLAACGSSTSSTLTYETSIVTIQTSTTTLTVTAELADDVQKQSVGLMNRTSLDAGTGMLFVFSEEGERSFWMKDTYISLDMIFINSSKEVVYIVESATPLSEERISSTELAQYVLEVNGGYADENGLSVGDTLTF
jgi:uncharacterized protein